MRPTIAVGIDSALQDFKNMIKNETDAGKRLNMIALVTFLLSIQKDWDSCAASRVEEIEILSNFLKRGDELAPESLSQSLNYILADVEQNLSDLRISALDAMLERLNKGLIDLQIWLEASVSEAAQVLLTETYVFLKQRSERLAMMKKLW